MEDIKARGMISCTVAIALSLLTACGQGGTTFEGGDDQKLGTAVPSAIRTSNLPDNSLLRVFLDVNGERHPMTFNGSAAEITVTNLPAGANTVAIVFEYQLRNFGDVILATATQTLTLQPGQNSLAFNEQDYQFPDDDGDGASNLAEIRNNTDPGDPTDWRPRQWGTAGRISNALPGNVGVPSLAVDPSGNGLVVWSQLEPGVNNVWVQRFVPDSGWGNAKRLEFDDTTRAVRTQVAMDANGNGIAVWQQGNYPDYSILARRFEPASGWGTPVRLDLESSDLPQFHKLAMSASGVAVVFWSDMSGIRANGFDGTAWGGATLILHNSNSEYASFPEVALDANGNALVIWLQGGNLWANRYIADTGWGTPTQIASLGSLSSEVLPPYNIAMDNNGNGMAVWVETVDARATFRASRFDATTGMWGDAILIVSPSVDSFFNQPPTVAFDAAGNALAIWRQNSGEGFNSIWANRFDAVTTAWGSATLIEDMDTPAALAVDGALAVRANGEAWAVWSQTGGMFANRFDPLAQAWGTPVLIGNSGWAKIALADDGRGLAVWSSGVQRQSGNPSTFAIFSNRLQ